MSKELLSSLVTDTRVFPRHRVSEEHVASLREAIRAGVELPPLVICKQTLRVVDGFHRREALLAEGAVYVEVDRREYETEADLFLDAVRLNSSHGLPLTEEDRTLCGAIATQLRVPDEPLALVLSVSVEKVRTLTEAEAVEKRSARQKGAGTKRCASCACRLTDGWADAKCLVCQGKEEDNGTVSRPGRDKRLEVVQAIRRLGDPVEFHADSLLSLLNSVQSVPREQEELLLRLSVAIEDLLEPEVTSCQ